MQIQLVPGPVNMVVQKSGYLYVYVSNESNMNVYFDDVVINHKTGPVLEVTNYKPFGCEIVTLSTKSFGKLGNKYRFNKGSELQDKEFSDGSGLNWYATHFRMYDPEIGRWHVIDPKPDYSQSLYSAMGNNPILNNDPLGDTLAGINKTSASRELKIIRQSFKGKEARELRSLFKIGKDGMSFNRINNSDAAVSKLKTPEAQALARGYIKTINSEKSVFVNVLKGDNEVGKIENSRVGSQFKATDGSPSLIASMSGRQYDNFGGGVTSPASSDGNYLVGIRIGTNAETNYVNGANGETVSQALTAGELNTQEILGHALGGLSGVQNNGQQAIRASNVYLRNESMGIYRNGGGSHGAVMSEEDANAIPGYLAR